MTSTQPPSASAEAIDFVAMVRRRDYRRYLAIQLAPPAKRGDLYTLSAFATEMLHIPRHVREPLAGFMRFAWWREALEEMQAGKPVRPHPMLKALVPLCAVLPDLQPHVLEPLIACGQQQLEDSTNADAIRMRADALLTEGWQKILRQEDASCIGVLACLPTHAKPGLRSVFLTLRYALKH